MSKTRPDKKPGRVMDTKVLYSPNELPVCKGNCLTCIMDGNCQRRHVTDEAEK